MKTLTKDNIRAILCFELDPEWSPGTRQRNQSRPVFRVTFTNGDMLVLKVEISQKPRGVGSQSVEYAAALMRRVSEHVSIELLTADELTALRLLRESQFQPGDDAARTRAYLLSVLDEDTNVYYKMPFVENLRSASALERGNGLDAATKSRKAIRLLNKLKDDKTAIRKLGKIAAVDLFNGNTDRFAPDGKVYNPGNLIFQKQEDKRYLPVGLDFFEAQGIDSSAFGAPSADWGGKFLKTEDSIMDFAVLAINGLNDLFRANLGNAATTTALLDENTLEDFAYGMRRAVTDMREYFDSTNPSRSGIRAKMLLLGWDKPLVAEEKEKSWRSKWRNNKK